MKVYLTRTLSIILLVVLFTSGCTSSTPIPPTATPVPPTQAPPTPVPTDTIRPSDTPIPPTNTPEPTSTPTPVPPPVIPMAEQRYTVEGGGFSFQAPEGYLVTAKLYSATITSEDMMSTNITLSGAPNPEHKTLEDIKNESTQSPEEGAPIAVEVSEMISTTVGGEDALMFDVIVDFMIVITSTVVVATPNDGAQQFSGTAVGMDMASMMGGLLGGLLGGDETATPSSEELAPTITAKDLLNAILTTIQFQEIPETLYLQAYDLAKCSVSRDKTYGLTEDNPIILYQYPGESRLGDYFAMVAGPKGQPVTYELSSMESQMGEGEAQNIVKYNVTYESLAEPVIFYIKEVEPETIEEIQQPQAPTGFTCKKP